MVCNMLLAAIGACWLHQAGAQLLSFSMSSAVHALCQQLVHFTYGSSLPCCTPAWAVSRCARSTPTPPAQ
jgi:hypothetical protein